MFTQFCHEFTMSLQSSFNICAFLFTPSFIWIQVLHTRLIVSRNTEIPHRNTCTSNWDAQKIGKSHLFLFEDVICSNKYASARQTNKQKKASNERQSRTKSKCSSTFRLFTYIFHLKSMGTVNWNWARLFLHMGL